MPSTEWNLSKWNDRYHWDDGGDAWSLAWGNVEMQWQSTLRPRIHRFVPTGRILEIGPGHGRWTAFLKDLCDELVVVDLSPRCIDACKKRFGETGNIRYFVNDGSSLEMIEDDSVDFVFSFDSLVHVEADVISDYLDQLARKIRKEGAGFIHHSNAGAYSTYFKILKLARPVKPLLRLARLGTKLHSRGLSMTAAKFRQEAETAGLRCLSQEIINWDSRLLIDCISVFARHDASWSPQPGAVIKNRRFTAEAHNAAMIAPLYTGVQKSAL